MADLRFEWVPRKDRANQKKHGVSFTEAKTVFLDEFARIIDDPESDEGEERFLMLGMSIGLRVLVVCHCVRGSGQVIRIISARRADASERKEYAGYLP
ncbi:MAG: BrnT family toxin [Gammaproteobacteria bacterium]|nr:BrnT family toxin [Gammaproteobacteria bacterium]